MAGRGPNKQSPHDLSVEEFLERLDSLSNDRLFSEHHAAAMVGKSVKTLQEERRIFNRTRERNPADAEALKQRFVPWTLVGAGSIRYRLGDLRAWVKRQQFGGEYDGAEFESPIVEDGAGIMFSRLADGRIPFAVQNGKLVDFIDTSDEEVDAVETMHLEEAGFIADAGMRLVAPAD